MSNAYLSADQLTVPPEANQVTISLSGATSDDVSLGGLRKVIWVLSDKDIYLNVSKAAVPGDLTANAADRRRFTIRANVFQPIAQNNTFDTVWAVIKDGSGTASVLIQIGAEVNE